MASIDLLPDVEIHLIAVGDGLVVRMDVAGGWSWIDRFAVGVWDGGRSWIVDGVGGSGDRLLQVVLAGSDFALSRMQIYNTLCRFLGGG